jgi:CSLREA domain-containing protein/uncharacterized repeat protein (TIGR01451 family)
MFKTISPFKCLTIGLILLALAAAPPLSGSASPLVTINVTTTADEYNTNEAACSLREAIQAANTGSYFGGCTAGGDANTIVLPPGTYTLTRTNLANLNEDENITGDLDILAPLTITGAGAGSTFIQAGTDTSNGIDKVFGINPPCIDSYDVTIQDVTIRYGRNTQAWGSGDYSHTGGGLDWCSDYGIGDFTLRDAIVTENTNVYGWGGGINVDTLEEYTGTITLDNVVVSNNRALNTIEQVDGGGLNIWCSTCSVVIQGSTISGNQVANSFGKGGGIFYRPSYAGGSLAIHNSTISGNTSAGKGGGLALEPYDIMTVTLDQGTRILNNTAGGSGGGVYFNGLALNPTAHAWRDLVISGNQAGGEGGGGLYIYNQKVNLQYSRIVANTASGSGSALVVSHAASVVNATHNWWGCNSGPGGDCNGTLVVSGSLTTNPYLEFSVLSDPGMIALGGSSTMTAGIFHDSVDNPVDPAGLIALFGVPVGWSATNGTLSDQQAAIGSGGTATAVLTNPVNCLNSSADATLDSTTVTSTVGITCTGLTVSKTHSDIFHQGDVGLTYTLSVVNESVSATSGPITVTDTLPDGLTATGLSGDGWDCTLATLTCTRSDPLGAAASAPPITLTVDVWPDAPLSLINRAGVTGSTGSGLSEDLTTILLRFYLPLLLKP